jgi:hypothetical protein
MLALSPKSGQSNKDMGRLRGVVHAVIELVTEWPAG